MKRSHGGARQMKCTMRSPKPKSRIYGSENAQTKKPSGLMANMSWRLPRECATSSTYTRISST